jgi:integrase
MAALDRQEGLAAGALKFLVLTATRIGQVLGATWNEIDLDARMWVIPASRSKGGREHRVPLSDATIAILRDMQAIRRGDYVFPGGREGRPLSQTSLLNLLHASHPALTVHGFRSTFRDYCAEHTNYENHVVEMALAHAIPSAVEAAYRRGDLYTKRVRLMTDWAKFAVAPSAAPGSVVPIGRRK